MKLKWKRLILQVCACCYWQSLQISSSEARQLLHKKYLCLSSWGSVPARWQFGVHMTAARDELGRAGEWILVILQNSINLKYINLRLPIFLPFKAQVHLQHYINTGSSLNKTKRHCQQHVSGIQMSSTSGSKFGFFKPLNIFCCGKINLR